VRKLIRNGKEGGFFAQGKWISDVIGADGFKDIEQARKTAEQFQLHDAYFYYLLGDEMDPRYDYQVELWPTTGAAHFHMTPR